MKLLLGIISVAMLTESVSAHFALAARGNIVLNGNGVVTDSWNSTDTNFSTSGAYDAGKTSSNGSIASVSGIVTLGNHVIKGSLFLGPTANYTGGPGAAITGQIYTNFNGAFPDVSIPVGGWSSAPVVSGTNFFTVSGYYRIDSTNAAYPIVVNAGIVVNLNVTSTANYTPIIIIHGGATNSGSANFYLNGPQVLNLKPNTALDASPRPTNLRFYGLPSLTTVSLNGNFQFVGIVYAPNADLSVPVGAINQPIIGSLTANSISMNGGMVFHYDEALTPPPVSASIVLQPTNRMVQLGSNVTFTASVNGIPPFQYQWRFNNTNISGATSSTYLIPSVTVSNQGVYSVTISNSAGGVISSNAFLTVKFPPLVSLQLSAGVPQLNLNGMVGSNFVAQYCTDLTASNWLDLFSITNFSGNPYQFVDPDGATQPTRFYRVLMQ